MILMAAVLVMFAACGGGSKSGEATESAVPAASETVEAVASSASNDLLAKYAEFVDKAVPLIQKMKTGDMAATTEYGKIAQELATFVQEHQSEFTALTGDELAKYTELSEKLANAAQ